MVATKLQTNKLEAAQKAIKAALVRGFLLETAAARVFFTQLVTKHEYEEAPKWMGVDTACTNGKIVRYSPDFIVGLTHAELVGVLAHEALHAGLGHQARRGSREPVLWNFAADLEINPL